MSILEEHQILVKEKGDNRLEVLFLQPARGYDFFHFDGYILKEDKDIEKLPLTAEEKQFLKKFIRGGKITLFGKIAPGKIEGYSLVVLERKAKPFVKVFSADSFDKYKVIEVLEYALYG